MPNGAYIAIGITLFFCAFAFAQPIIDPIDYPLAQRNLSFFYITTGLSLILGLACFIPIVLRVKQNRYNRKHKIYKNKPAISHTTQSKPTPGDWYSNLQNFDLGRLTLAGWFLSLLSVAVGIGLFAICLGNNSIDGASRGVQKVFGIIMFGIMAVFFTIGKWILVQLNIKIYKH
jgi:hypothetical protein